MATHVSRPVQSFYCATVRASIWRNEGTRGAFHAITLSRTFMDAEGHPKSAGSFGRHDLSAVATVVAQAEQWVREHGVYPPAHCCLWSSGQRQPRLPPDERGARGQARDCGAVVFACSGRGASASHSATPGNS